ncbi:MAG: ankyrin repeat domain-containing protein [Bacteroidota bacterium]
MDNTHLEKLIEDNQLANIIALLNEQPELAIQATSQQISPVLLAAYYKRPEIANAIANFVPELSLFEACALGKLEEVSLLISENPPRVNDYSGDGFTPLGLACYFGYEDIAQFLISKGAEVNVASKNGFNVFPIHSAVAANNINITKMLFEAGAYPNVCQKSGMAPLHSAAQLGNIELIILLLENGADVNLRMEGGKLPADLAAQKGFEEIAEILRDDD